MNVTFFHKTFEFNVPQDVISKCLKACELLDKEEEVFKKTKQDFDITSDELFPLIALSAVIKQTSSNIDNVDKSEDTHTITIKLPSFNNISSMLEVKVKTNSINEQNIINSAAKILSNCEMCKASFEQEDADLYRVAVLNVLIEQLW